VVIPTRLAGLWPRWGEAISAEAARIVKAAPARTVRITATSSMTAPAIPVTLSRAGRGADCGSR
jgi:hypothetical protein